MELVKQIKAAENQAKELVQDANAEVQKLYEKAKEDHVQVMSDMQRERISKIQAAVAEAEIEAQKQAQEILDEASETCNKIESDINSKLDSLASRVVEYIWALAKS